MLLYLPTQINIHKTCLKLNNNTSKSTTKIVLNSKYNRERHRQTLNITVSQQNIFFDQ